MKKDEADAKSVCLIFAFDGSTRAPQARSPCPMGKAKKKRDFLNYKENRVKPKISTMVFLGERKSILPGAEAAADKDLHSTAIRPRKRRTKPQKTDPDRWRSVGDVSPVPGVSPAAVSGHEAGIRRTAGAVCLHPL